MRRRQKKPAAEVADLPPVDCFLYCSLMDPEVLAGMGIEPSVLQPARLAGWRLTFTPEPDIRPAPGHEVDGFVTQLEPGAMDRVQAAKADAGYRPLPVQVHTEHGAPVALAYASGRAPAAAKPADLEAYVQTCWRLGLPEEYCDGLKAEAARLPPAKPHAPA